MVNTMNTLILAVDDGLTNGHLNWADILFLLGAIFAVLGALSYAPIPQTDPPRRAYGHWGPVLVALAVGFISFGLFLL
jgi:hypothetical protein